MAGNEVNTVTGKESRPTFVSRVVEAFTQDNHIRAIRNEQAETAFALIESTEGRPRTREVAAKRIDALFDEKVRLLQEGQQSKIVGTIVTAIGATLLMPAVERITGIGQKLSGDMIKINELLNTSAMAHASAERVQELILKLNSIQLESLLPIFIIGGSFLLAGVGFGLDVLRTRKKQEENIAVIDDYTQAILASGSKPVVGPRQTVELSGLSTADIEDSE